MTAYLALSYNDRPQLEEAVTVIKNTLQQKGISCFVFADHFSFSAADAQEMMQEAVAAIDRCDILIALTNYKAIGIGVEAGYARAKNKTVIYIRDAGAEHSTTVAGISNRQVIYNSMDALAAGLGKALD